MELSSNPYTSFKAINANDGLIRIADRTISTTDYAVTIAVDQGAITAERKIYAKNAGGSLMLYGNDVVYGTTTIICNGNIAAGGVATASCAISGLLTTSVIFVSAATTAQVAAFVPFGATCATAGKAIVQYFVGAASAAITTVPINYIYWHPQTGA